MAEVQKGDDMTFPKVSACLFDMDGLMIDSENIYTDVTNEVLKPYGKVMTWEIKAGLMGRPAHDAARYLLDKTQVPLTVEELLGEMDKKLPVAFAQVQALPGVLKLVKHLQKHKIPMAIATGSKLKNFLIKTEHLPELFAPFGTNVLCGDDPVLEGKGKPDPTIFLEAAKLLGVDLSERGRQRILVFEDGAPGVQAAKAAGMPVVWIPDPNLVMTLGTDHGLDPTHTHETMQDFVPEHWGLPPYDSNSVDSKR